MFNNPDVALDAVEKMNKHFLCGECRTIIPLGIADRKEDARYIYIHCIQCKQLCRIEKSLLPK